MDNFIEDMIEIGRLRIPKTGTQSGKGPSELAVEEARDAVISSIPGGERMKRLFTGLRKGAEAKRLRDPAKKTAEEVPRLIER